MNPKLPLLVFDGDCGFCRLWIDRWKLLTGDRVEYAPFQQVAAQFPRIALEQFRAAVQLIEPAGENSHEVSSGAAAVFRLLTYAGRPRLRWVYDHIPGVAPVSEAAYRFVAAHRPALYTLTRWLWGARFERPSYEVSRWLFLRLLALAYLFAFVSLHVQIDGLIGSHGILPAANFLQAIGGNLGVESFWGRFWAFPTLAWLSSSDAFLHFLSLGGAILSVAALVGLFPIPIFALLWLFYLSLVGVGQDFLSFQWDILLLETGFLAIFFAPRRLLPGPSRGQPSPVVLWLLRILLFRLLFSSGVVKLASGDPTWRNLTALQYHYETQPLPTPLAWYAQQLPAGFQSFSALVMFFIELAVPFLIFTPRRLRFLGCALMLFLQGLLLLTGNYAFFNLLTIALCLLLLDDACLRRFLPPGLVARFAASDPQLPEPRPKRILAALLAVAIVFAGAIQVARLFTDLSELPSPARRFLARMSRFYIVNSYGLFAVMTTRRAEIIVEGSNDGQTWLPYEFKYKPGDVKRRPPIVAPHQPRLDWQMWFAALSDYRSDPWFVNLMVRLLEGNPAVLALLQTNPFPNAPPRYVRAELYDYHFTNFAERRATGAWWRRAYAGLYFPVAGLRGH
ncbi:MAG TPA: lipase maturation factor family protein [Bryobacterales bacterium]|nr:lipase maturation factor family protein [Bryobacterales bacterium]